MRPTSTAYPQAHRHWFGLSADASQPTCHSVHYGFSGAVVYRLEDRTPGLGGDRQQWALKAWPVGSTPDRIRRVHEIIRTSSQHTHLISSAQPGNSGDTVLVIHERCYDLHPWCPGQPLDRDASAAAILRGVEALAEAHSALAVNTNLTLYPKPLPPCIANRIERCQFLNQRLPQLLSHTWPHAALMEGLTRQFSRSGSADSIGQLAEHLRIAQAQMRHSVSALERGCNALRELRLRPPTWRQHYVFRDVHREHILFSGPREGRTDVVVGIIDYDAVGWDSPAADLARWLGGFRITDSEFVREATAEYRRLRPFSNQETELVAQLVLLNPVINLANWLVWLVDEKQRFFVDSSRVCRRLTHLIDSICRI